MSEVTERLNTILEIEDEAIEGEFSEVVVTDNNTQQVVTTTPSEENLPAIIDTHNQDVEFDYETARTTNRDLLEIGQEALEELLKVAKESQHPRAYEVAFTGLKNLSDMTDKLMILHQKHKEVTENGKAKQQDSQSVNVEKAIFVGTTNDLLKKIKNKSAA